MRMKAMVATTGAVAALWAFPACAQSAEACRPAGELARLSDLPEASGLVASRVTPGRLWLHNDSGEPELHAVDLRGKTTGRITLDGAALEDWEALTTGPCGDGHCLYVGDIGDNDAERPHVTIYRVREPADAAGAVKVDGVFRATYPDGAHDAETLLVSPDGRLHIVTKGDTGAVALYRFPERLDSDATMSLERVGEPMTDGQPDRKGRITDGAVSSDGRRVALRTNTAVTFYAADAFFAGRFEPTATIDLSGLNEPQGEALAFGDDGTIYLGGEGGGGSRAGTLGVMTCRWES